MKKIALITTIFTQNNVFSGRFAIIVDKMHELVYNKVAKILATIYRIERKSMMKATVNQDTCIGCGMCIDICPEVFKYNEDGKSESTVDDIPENLQEKANESAEVCPVEAIAVK